MPHDNKNGFAHLILLVIFFIVGITIIGVILLSQSQLPVNKKIEFEYSKKDFDKNTTPIEAGKILSSGRCEDEGVPYKLGASPMDPGDFSIVIPYGLMIDSHVTPIDHQYFSPKNYNSPLDAYEVYAMGDALITDIQTRERNHKGKSFQEYRLVFTITCTYFYYYDLVTSLEPGIKVGSKVKEGQLIGYIGGQTLDFAVWDTTKPLDGFVIPEHYIGEPWKIYTADPLNYYSDELKELILSRYIRTADPISGKIDHDIDGKIIGNWFLEGTEGYAGKDGGTQFAKYWSGHLAIAPDHIDPTGIIVSIGDFEGNPEQFIIQDLVIHPKKVGTDTGIVRYELGQYSYIKPDESHWDRNSLSKGLKIVPNVQSPTHCVLIQLMENRRLKIEYFFNEECSDGLEFTDRAKFFTR